MEEEQPVEVEQEVTHKRVRQRKRQLYTNIRAQMEFYFSDSNLSKDRFLSQLIQDDPCKYIIWKYEFLCTHF